MPHLAWPSLSLAKAAAKARGARLGSRASRSGPRRLDPRFSPLLTVPAAPFRRLAERERRVIGERTRLALQAAKKRGVKLGGTNRKSLQNREEALARAERLRPIMSELAGMSARAAAAVLNERGIETPAGGRWHAVTVNRVRQRLQRTT